MNKSRKLMSLLLVLVLALPMVFMTVNALAAEPEYYDVVKTSGGRLNVWPRPVKESGSSTKSLKNGTRVTLGEKTYSSADKRWMVYVTFDGGSGWVDAKYIGKKAVVEPTQIELLYTWTKAKLRGTARNSEINIWPNNEKDFARRAQKPLLKQVPLGYVFENVKVYSNGTAWVEFQTADLKTVSGYIRTKYLVNLTPKAPAPK